VVLKIGGPKLNFLKNRWTKNAIK